MLAQHGSDSAAAAALDQTATAAAGRFPNDLHRITEATPMALPTGLLAKRSEQELRDLRDTYAARKRWAAARGKWDEVQRIGFEIDDVQKALDAKAARAARPTTIDAEHRARVTVALSPDTWTAAGPEHHPLARLLARIEVHIGDELALLHLAATEVREVEDGTFEAVGPTYAHDLTALYALTDYPLESVEINQHRYVLHAVPYED